MLSIYVIVCFAMLFLMNYGYQHIFIGAPGLGKSYIAGHKSAKVWENLKESGKRLYRKFDCTSIEALYSNLRQLFTDLDITFEPVADNRPKTWDIIKTFFETLNFHHPDYHKIFIFDDVEQLSDLLKVLDDIGRYIMKPSRQPSDAKVPDVGTWTMFVTSMKSVPTPAKYQHIGKNSFIQVSRFTLDEAKILFKFTRLDDDSLEKLVDTLDGMALALRIFLKSIESEQVNSFNYRHSELFLFIIIVFCINLKLFPSLDKLASL